MKFIFPRHTLIIWVCLLAGLSLASEATTGSQVVAVQPAKDSTSPTISLIESTSSATMPTLRISQVAGVNPWSSLDLKNDPNHFQFAVVTDRTGGHRPGVFEEGIRKLNLLRPEFVMSVGDLIEGYTSDSEKIKREWDEFQGFISELKMPFFYVPGNHDLSNVALHEEWSKRFGRKYFHFVYGNVLFLCLNSEDPAGEMSETQLSYFEKAVSEHPDVRWTLAFLHRPLWVGMGTKVNGQKLKEADVGQDENYQSSTWERFEDLLAGRKHTVFAGHFHNYCKYVRNNSDYIILATTGGGSAMRGAWGYGEFDHFAWVTMTDEGPVIANLELDGIWDKDVFTQELGKLTTPLMRRGITAAPMITSPLPFTSESLTLKLQNDGDIPVKLNLKMPDGVIRFEPKHISTTVEPNSVLFQTVSVTAKSIKREDQLPPGLNVSWHATYAPPGIPKLELDGQLQLNIDPKRPVRAIDKKPKIDGKLNEYGELPAPQSGFAQMVGRKTAWKGPQDASFQLTARHDKDNIYVAIRVKDNAVLTPQAGDGLIKGDAIELRIDPRPETDTQTSNVRTMSQVRPRKANPKRTRAPGRPDSEHVIRLISGVKGGSTSSTVVAEDPDSTQTLMTDASDYEGARGACIATDTGYDAEFAIPVTALDEWQGDSWKSFRLNVTLYDRDEESGDKAILWWKPDWEGPESYPKSGMFVRR